MAVGEAVVVRLSDLQDGQEAECFAALVKKVRGTTKRNQPFIKCYFRDKRVTLEAPLWADHRLHRAGRRLGRGAPTASGSRRSIKAKYGLQIDILDIRPTAPRTTPTGYDFGDLYESIEYPTPISSSATIHGCIERCIDEPASSSSSCWTILDEHDDLFRKIRRRRTSTTATTAGCWNTSGA